jgi:2-methylcitrate dehydratase PrpD
VEADLADGRTVSVRCDYSKGSPENPLSRAEIEEKFRHYGKGVLAPARIEEAIAAITKLEGLKSVRGLMDLLRAGGEQQRKTA